MLRRAASLQRCLRKGSALPAARNTGPDHVRGHAMPNDQRTEDIEAIEAVIARQFGSLNWGPGTSADWDAFAADFFPDAALYPAARPAKRQTVQGFIERMKEVAATKLRSFDEVVLGAEIRVFGNVAVVLAACEMTENGTEVSRGVEMVL